MTSQKDQIQRLITEIEAALAKPVSRLPLGLSGEATQQRQLLGKLYDYLQSLGEVFESPGGWGPIDPSTGQLFSPPALTPDAEESAAHVLQGLLLEMRYLKENSLKPMRQELELLQQRRDSLQAEVNVLEAQHGAGPLQSEQQIDAFLETLMQRLQQQLSAQMAQNFATMEAAAVENLSASVEDNPVPLLPEQRLAQVQLLQAQSDQLLLRLDSTLTAVFDSLQKSVDSYRESLEEGLDQMHGLGRQGEVIVHAFINHLAQQLGQDASSYLADELGPALQRVRLQKEPETVADVELEAAQLDELNQAIEDLSLEEEAGDSADDAGFEVDPDLALFDMEQLEDAIASSETLDLDALGGDIDGESTVIQPADELETLDDLLLDGLPLDDSLLGDATEDITLIQTDDTELQIETDDTERQADPTTETMPAAADAAVDSDSEPAPLPLNTSLGAIDESLDLLAMGIGADAALDQTVDDSNQDLLTQIAAESDLFNFDADFDLGLEPDEPNQEPASDLLEADQLPDRSLDLVERSPNQSALDIAESEPFPPGSEEALSATETAALEASQVADDWLFSQTTADDTAALDPLDDLTADPPEISGEAIPPATMQALFGDSVELSAEVAQPADETITSLSELLPDETPSDTVEEFPNDVPDDVYIAASANEDLINLTETGVEQRLLLDFDDDQLVERLDEDLQKLAGDTFSTDYGVEEDALDPLDQTTLETIVRELNLEDLDLDDELSNTASVSESSSEEESSYDIEADISSQVDEASADFDLFAGFSTDTASIDDPSAEDEPLADTAELAVTAAQPLTDEGTQELDFLGLAADPLVDALDDELTDSLENELGDLSEHSDSLSQDLTETMVGQPRSDLEAPVVAEDDTLSFPTVDDTEPQLDSAAVPDVPPDLLIDDGLSNLSPEADDFLQAEQQAFWQAIAADESSQAGDPEAAELIPDADLEPLLLDPNEEQNLDNLLGLDTLSPHRPETEDEIDFGDLDELFGQSSPPELADLEQADSTDNEAPQTPDSLADLEFELDSVTSPEALIPRLDEPEAAIAAAVVSEGRVDSPIDSQTRAAEAIVDSGDDDGAIPSPSVGMAQGDWFLGLDIGSTGLSAVIMDRRTGQVYPLYWQTATDSAKHFRLPATAVMTSTQETLAVGYDAMAELGDLVNESGLKAPELVGVNRLKPLLKVAVGHGQTLANSDPWLRWSDTVELPMLQVLQAMVALLKYMVSQGQAVGLDQEELQQLWENLQGVVVGYPTNWPDTYSFNLREAVLAAGLIDQPGKVLFVEDAIATVLSGLPDPETLAVPETVSLSRQPSLYNCQWQDNTVVISGGAVMTELGLVNLPKNLANLNYADFALRGFAYAGDALDQDIVCQLLLPAERRQPLGETDRNITWDWQGYLSPEDANWEELQLDTLTLPAVGHVDWVQRYHLQQRLQASSLGQSLLAAARHLKLALQQRNQIRISLAGQQWLIKRRYLESLIFLPYIQRISRYLNVLLGNHAVDAQAIKQVICTGGSASLPAIARWLRQKFPNATIIQDTYATELPQSCSRVAYGLVNLARYCQVLNVTRQQYSDYFLLMELLRVFPQQPLPVGAIMHLLEQRGVNTQACHLHILALLEGHLPPGLVPTAADRGLISDRTTDLATYRALLKTPLFSKTVTESGGVIYTPNEAQAEQLRAYFNRILIGKAQTLEEPLIAQLEALV